MRGLSVGHYSPEQIDEALVSVFGVDTQLLHDGTYFVIDDAGAIAAAGGWSRRCTLYGGDQHKSSADPLLDPSTDAARIRAFFVGPNYARRGMARRLYLACEAAAVAEGFGRFALGATLPGIPLYEALGFRECRARTRRCGSGSRCPSCGWSDPFPPDPDGHGHTLHAGRRVARGAHGTPHAADAGNTTGMGADVGDADARAHQRAFEMAFGERPVAMLNMPLARNPVARHLALHVIPFPKNAPTSPEIRLPHRGVRGGTRAAPDADGADGPQRDRDPLRVSSRSSAR